jgi:hypothetical protein
MSFGIPAIKGARLLDRRSFRGRYPRAFLLKLRHTLTRIIKPLSQGNLAIAWRVIGLEFFEPFDDESVGQQSVLV